MEVDYVSIPIENLIANSIVDFALFLETPNGKVLYREKNLKFTLNDAERLSNNKIKVLYVKGADTETFKSYLKQTGQIEDSKEHIEDVEKISFDITNPQKVDLYYDLRQSYFPVKSLLILEGTTPSFTIYRVKELKPVVVYPEEGQEPKLLEKRDIQNLTGHLVVHNDDFEKYHKYLRSATKEVLKSTSQPIVKAIAIKEGAKAVVMELMANPRSKKVVNKVKSETERLIEAISKDMGLINTMIRLGENDYYTFTHSVNVSLLCLGVGKTIGLKESQLYDLALGGILHDIGKSEIHNKLLNKPGALTDDEYVTMKQHVNASIEIFKTHEDLPKDAYYPLAQHHERLSGNGYPFGLKGDEIHLYGKISAIADFYDAMTTNRSYQNAREPFQALEFMSKEKFRTELDQKALRTLIMVLGGKFNG
jgi:HD-GYP domain-containing protein (c-di-GMP phosphodiesterase class II)